MSEAFSNVVEIPHGRVAPHNLDAERSLLGGIFLDREQFAEVQLIVKPADFYREANRKIFEAMCAVSARGEPVDRVMVGDELRRAGALEAVGGDEYLERLDAFTPIAGQVSFYAGIVSNKSLMRRTIETASAIAQLGYEWHGEAREFVDTAEKKLFEISQVTSAPEITAVRDLVPRVFRNIEKRYEHNSDLTGAPSGLDELDAITNGFQEGDFILLAARPSMGKTSLLLDLVRATATAGGGVAVFEMEMPKDQLVEKLLSAESKVNLSSLRTGRIAERDWSHLARGGGKVSDMPVYIDDQARTILEVRAQARRLALRLAKTPTPLRMVCVDYIQRMRGTGGAHVQREEVIASISRELKSLATELMVPVIAVSSLNRELEKRPEKRPQMSDLRESGALEFDADLILFVYRGEVYKDTSCPEGQAEIIIGKNRNGPLGVAKVAFVAPYTSFRNLAPRDAPQKSLPLEAPEREEPPPPPEDRYP